MTAAIVVSPQTRNIALAGLPTAARMAFTLAERILCGRLEVTLPDGRQLIFQGEQPGPTAQMQVNDYCFAWRTVRSGDIGVAEAYLRGEWDTPDLTQFLYLFCVNRDMMESVLGNKFVGYAAFDSVTDANKAAATPLTSRVVGSLRRGRSDFSLGSSI